MVRNLLIILFSSICVLSNAQNFTLASGASTDHDVTGTKEGGAVWADFDNDGDLDVLINTSANSRLIRNEGGFSFTDISTTHATGITLVACDRSALWGDLNNDGLVDFVRNSYSRIEIYLNRGILGGAYADYSFGVDFPSGGTDEMLPNLVITNLELGTCSTLWGGAGRSINAEGVGLIDYNNDGWLDLIFENGECGIDILENRLDEPPTEGTTVINTRFDEGGDNDGNIETSLPASAANNTEAIDNDFFRQVTTATAATPYLGFPNTSGNGDFFTIGDYDADGFVDLVVRKPTGTNSIWKNDGDGTFSDIGVDMTGGSLISPTENDTDGGKGGVVMCDFDKDGDFDLFWSDGGPSQVWLQHPLGTFTATAKPAIPGTPDIDGCACGDVDLDGDTDLFLGNNTGNSYLFINTTTSANDVSALNFTLQNIAVNANAEGVNMIDYNGDGDYDLYVNVNNAANQIWINDYCDDGDCNFLNILIEDCVDGTTVTRPVVGASVYLEDLDGNIVTAKVDGSTASGHGAQNPPSPLIGIPDPDEEYVAKIIFPEKNGVTEMYSYQFTPSLLTTPNTLVLTAVIGTDGNLCTFSALPVELLYFTAEKNEEGIMVKWATVTEMDNDYFVLEKSHNGKVFDEIARIQGSGTTNTKVTYSHLDPYPYNGFNYYRLVQYDFDGKSTKSKIIRIKAEGKQGDGIAIYPNPVKDRLTINFSKEWQNSKAIIAIHDVQGNKIVETEVSSPGNSMDFEWDHNIEGFYWIKISNPQLTVVKKLVKISE